MRCGVCFEHKSKINKRDLMRQLLRYQTGLYERAWSPVVTVVVHQQRRGAVRRARAAGFATRLESADDALLRAYDGMVIDFNAVVLDLQDPQFQKRLLKAGHRSERWGGMRWDMRLAN